MTERNLTLWNIWQSPKLHFVHWAEQKKSKMEHYKATIPKEVVGQRHPQVLDQNSAFPHLSNI